MIWLCVVGMNGWFVMCLNDCCMFYRFSELKLVIMSWFFGISMCLVLCSRWCGLDVNLSVCGIMIRLMFCDLNGRLSRLY